MLKYITNNVNNSNYGLTDLTTRAYNKGVIRIRYMLRLKVLLGLLSLTSLVALSISAPIQGSFDYTGLNQQVQNHEARITNSEKDIKALQDNTATPPAVDRVAVPAASPPSTEPPAPTPTDAAPVDPTPTPPNTVSHTDCAGPNGPITCP